MNQRDRDIANIDPADVVRAHRDMAGIKQARLVIFASVNGRDNWHPLLPAEVPAWVREESVMGRLVNGEMCMDTADGHRGVIALPAEGTGSLWYKAVKVETTH